MHRSLPLRRGDGIPHARLVSIAAILCAMGAAPRPAEAIVLNDVAADAAGGIGNYWDTTNQFANVVALALNRGDPYCTGTLINSRTIVTAGHCLVEDGSTLGSHVSETEIRFSPNSFIPNTNDRFVSGAAVLPGYQSTVFGAYDFAVISLDQPVTQITPAVLPTGTTPLFEYGSLAVIAGYGQNGTGSRPPFSFDNIDGKRRIGETILVALSPELSEGDAPLYVAPFRNPLRPGAADVLGNAYPDLPVPYYQAGTAPGDSGGPLFLSTQDGLVLIGTLVGGYGRRPGYGFVNVWTPIYTALDWLAAVNPLREVTAAGGDQTWSNAAAWIDPGGASEVPNNRDGDFSGSGTLGRYWNVTISAPGTMTLDMDAEVDSVTVAGASSTLDIAAPYILSTVVGFQQSAGTTTVSGTLAAPTADLSGGLLTGTGTVIAPQGLINRGGTLAPGTAGNMGVLTVAGSYQQTAGGTLAVRSLGGASDQLHVTGTAALGGTLAVSSPGTVTPGIADTVLQADGGISGSFASVSSEENFAFLDTLIGYGATTVSVTFERNAVPFTALAQTRNQASVATALESLSPANPVAGAVLQSSVAGAPAAFDQLSGEVHASTTSVLVGQSSLARGLIGARLRQGMGPDSDEATGSAVPIAFGAGEPEVRPLAFRPDGAPASTAARALASAAPAANMPLKAEAAPASPLQLATWMQGVGAWGRMSSTDGASGLSSNVGGLFAGLDATYEQRFRLGIAGGYTSSDYSVSGLNSSGSTSDYHLAGYGAALLGPVALRLGGAYAWSDIDTSRMVDTGGLVNWLSSSSDARTGQVFGELAYPTVLLSSMGAVSFEPFAGLAYVHVSSDAFTETGGAAALSGEASRFSTTYSTLGLRAAVPLAFGEAWKPVLHGELGWRHAFGDLTPTETLAFTAGNSAFTVDGLPIARDALVVEAGLDVGLRERVGLDLFYAGDLAADAQSHAVKGRLSVSF